MILENMELNLVWEDDFSTGSTINPKFWEKEVWPPKKVNLEVQSYTDSADNCYVSDGSLKIKAIRNGKN